MKKLKIRTFEEHLKEELKNEEFREEYYVELAKVHLAHRLAELRKEKNISQIELAKKARVSQQFISQLESAHGKNLTIATISKIAGSLGFGVKISFDKHKGIRVA